MCVWELSIIPAMCVFGRSIRDFIPVHPGRYLPHPAWRETLVAREEALRNRHQKVCERLSEHTRHLPPLIIGDHVRLQNQSGHHPTKWDRTGTVVEVRQFDQYVIRVDGSGRVTLRNRKFLRKYIPVVERDTLSLLPVPTVSKMTPEVSQAKPSVVTQSKPPTASKPHTPPATPTKSPSTKVLIKSPQNIVEPPDVEVQILPPVERQPTTPTTPHLRVEPQTSPATHENHATKRLPLALRQLQSHNSPGLTEENLQPPVNTRVTRQSTKHQ